MTIEDKSELLAIEFFGQAVAKNMNLPPVGPPQTGIHVCYSLIKLIGEDRLDDLKDLFTFQLGKLWSNWSPSQRFDFASEILTAGLLLTKKDLYAISTAELNTRLQKINSEMTSAQALFDRQAFHPFGEISKLRELKEQKNRLEEELRKRKPGRQTDNQQINFYIKIFEMEKKFELAQLDEIKGHKIKIFNSDGLKNPIGRQNKKNQYKMRPYSFAKLIFNLVDLFGEHTTENTILSQIETHRLQNDLQFFAAEGFTPNLEKRYKKRTRANPATHRGLMHIEKALFGKVKIFKKQSSQKN